MQEVLEKKEALQLKPWQPNKPPSRGAISYHDAVVNASYYIEGLERLIKIVRQKITNSNIVVDFGAGTGGSALYLLKRLKSNIKLWLVDNSAAWLGKAYETFRDNQNVKCFLLEKVNDRYATLAETIGEDTADHVISANTLHLIPNLKRTFKGIIDSLKVGGTFTFQSGNIMRKGREKGILMVDDTIKRVHGIALEIVRTDKEFIKHRKNLDNRIKIEYSQRKFMFPNPRPLETYLKMLKAVGFEYKEPIHNLIKINYKDWLSFLKVKRMQAGILPEIGGRDPTPEEGQDRDELITLAAKKLFEELETQNPFADDKCFTAEWVYVTAVKG